MGREQRKMSLALGCAHQLPRIGAPAIASARLGTAPRPDSRTTPLALTKAMACFEASEVSRTFARQRLPPTRGGPARSNRIPSGTRPPAQPLLDPRRPFEVRLCPVT